MNHLQTASAQMEYNHHRPMTKHYSLVLSSPVCESCLPNRMVSLCSVFLFLDKSNNRPVQPVAPMIASTPKSVQSPPAPTAAGIPIGRAEHGWTQSHQTSQQQVLSGLGSLNLTDMGHLYPSNISRPQGIHRC